MTPPPRYLLRTKSLEDIVQRCLCLHPHLPCTGAKVLGIVPLLLLLQFHRPVLHYLHARRSLTDWRRGNSLHSHRSHRCHRPMTAPGTAGHWGQRGGRRWRLCVVLRQWLCNICWRNVQLGPQLIKLQQAGCQS